MRESRKRNMNWHGIRSDRIIGTTSGECVEACRNNATIRVSVSDAGLPAPRVGEDRPKGDPNCSRPTESADITEPRSGEGNHAYAIKK